MSCIAVDLKGVSSDSQVDEEVNSLLVKLKNRLQVGSLDEPIFSIRFGHLI
jgi:hypothetical protein